MQEKTLDLNTRALEYAKQLQKGTGQAGQRMTIRYLREHGFDQAMAEKYQLGYVGEPMDREDMRFRGMLCIPYMTRAGVLVIKYRCPAKHDHREHGGKYGQYLGQPARLFNTQAFFDADETIGMAEGEMDSGAATEHLGVPTLGIPGVDSWTLHGRIWKLALKDYSNILVFADGDTAGLSLARTVASDIGSRAKIVKCDADQDVASMIAKGQAELLKSRAGL